MNLPKSSAKFFAFIAAVAFAATNAHAQFLFHNISGQFSTIIGTNLTSGATFTVGSQAILVTSLGVYDDQSDGLNQSHSVGLWDSGGLLTSATVPAGIGTVLLGDFRYVPIAPVVLSANTTYRIGANLGYNHAIPFDLMGVGGAATLDAAFSFANAKMRSGHETGFTEPNLTFFENLWAANLQYTAVPEPTALSLLAGGLVVVRLLRRRS